MRKPVTGQEMSTLARTRENAMRNGGMARTTFVNHYLDISSRLQRGQQMPAQDRSAFAHLYQLLRAEKAVEARQSAEMVMRSKGITPTIDRKLNEAEAELESMLVRAGL
jgi:hypothetical protein